MTNDIVKSDIVKTETAGNIGLIVLSKPPVNALGVALRAAVYDALQGLLTDDNIDAIVLYGDGKYFSAGADIKDLDRSAEHPTLPEVLKAINNSVKPVIASLHGIAFGGALELALAAQVRVAKKGLQIALPEVTLGLLPGAGGTQRLTRLTGVSAALDIICTGCKVVDEEALKLGIVSRLEDGTARENGLRAAADVLNGKLTISVTDELNVSSDPNAIDAARAKYAKRLIAPQRAIDAVEAATLPIDEGLARERALFMELVQSEERAGLVHAFFAERATVKIPEQSVVNANHNREIASVGIVGGGTMGVGIATAFALAGFPVTLIELQSEQLQRAHAGIEKNLQGALTRGKLTAQSHQKVLSQLTCTDELSQLSEVDLVIEAIFENMDAKADLFSKLDKICKPNAILATNTSYLDINEIAAVTSRPESVIGLHFFSPAHIMRLLEVVVAEHTAPELVVSTFDLAKKIRKIPVRSEVCEGFIGNRILTAYRKCTEYLLLDGASFEQIDNALECFGFAMGPFAVSDLAGLDIARANRQRKAATRPAEERYSRVSDLICNQGWFGRKTGQGYYVYVDKQKRSVNPAAIAIVEAERTSLGITPRTFSNDEIIARCMTAMIIEASNVIDEGIALRPVDIDAVKLFGYGFPRHRGGPMHFADQTGITELIKRIESYANEDSYFWKVPPLLLRLLKNKQSFADLNKKLLDGQ